MDEYEYAVQGVLISTGERAYVGAWITEEDARKTVKRWRKYEQENVDNGLTREFEYKLLRRRKAGPEEVVE